MACFLVFDVDTPNRKNNCMSAIGITVVEEGKISKALRAFPRRMSHRAELGLTVVKAEWNSSIGTKLMQKLIDYAFTKQSAKKIAISEPSV